MLRPTPEEVLTSIIYTFDHHIRPDPGSALAKSYSLTMSNMLRQLLLTLQYEEELIGEDTIYLCSSLRSTQSFLETIDSATEPVDKISKVLSVEPGSISTAKAAREYWRALRSVLEYSIKYLQGLRSQYGDQENYREVRKLIREYLDQSLNREQKLIDGAFTLARR